jgi:hypothetical protein
MARRMRRDGCRYGGSMRNSSLLYAVLILTALSACNRQPASNATGANDAGDFRPVASVKQVMLGITIPASNVVFAVAGEEPKDEVAWQSVEASALAVAESGNLMLMKPRLIDSQEWKQYALALVDVGVRAAEAARARDVDRTSLAGDDMYEVCERCHAKYLPTP